MTSLDDDFRRTQLGDGEAFARWVRRVEPQLRAVLRRFARAVDVEAVLQEGLLRMWLLAPTLDLTGKHASLPYASTIVRNLAVHEAKRSGALVPLEPVSDGPPREIPVAPAPVPDPGLREAVLACLRRLRGKPAKALVARLESQGKLPDRDLAARVGMTLNTFLQNVVRARRQIADCLKSHGVPTEEYVR